MFILFSIMLFFEVKQLYASAHFTGASRIAPPLYLVYGLAFGIYKYFMLFRVSAKSGIAQAIVCFVVPIVIYLVANKYMTRIIIGRTVRKYQNVLQDNILWATANRKCDISTSICAFIGLFVNPILGIVIFVLTK